MIIHTKQYRTLNKVFISDVQSTDLLYSHKIEKISLLQWSIDIFNLT